jgi:hypothetical protein
VVRSRYLRNAIRPNGSFSCEYPNLVRSTASGMLLQQLRCARAQVSAFVRTDAQNVAGFAVRSNATGARSNVSLHCVLGTEACARTQRRVRLSAGTRLCWNRHKCVRPQYLRSTALSVLDFPATQQKLKTKTKKLIKLN